MTHDGEPVLTGMAVSGITISLGGVLAGLASAPQDTAMYTLAGLIILGTIVIAGDPNR